MPQVAVSRHTGEMNRFRHRRGVLPGAVASAVAYDATDLPAGEHRGLPSPWITFIVSTHGPVRTMGTVHDPGPFEPSRATAYDVMVAGLQPVAARVEQPSEQSGVQLAVHPLAAPALFGCRASELLWADDGRDVLGRVAGELHDRIVLRGRPGATTRRGPGVAAGAGRPHAAQRRTSRGGAGLAAGRAQRRRLPGGGRRPRRGAEPATAAHADEGRDRALAQAAVPAASGSAPRSPT